MYLPALFSYFLTLLLPSAETDRFFSPVCVWPWECPQSSPSSLSVGARRSPQAFLWPPLPIMPHRLPVCTQNSELDTVTGGRRRQQCKFKDSLGVCVCVDFCGEGSSAFGLIGDALLVWFGGLYSGPYLASYRARMFLQRPQSFRSSATCCRSAAFSRSRKEARTVIWFSFSRRASRERFAATLFFFLLDQYFSSWARGI